MTYLLKNYVHAFTIQSQITHSSQPARHSRFCMEQYATVKYGELVSGEQYVHRLERQLRLIACSDTASQTLLASFHLLPSYQQLTLKLAGVVS